MLIVAWNFEETMNSKSVHCLVRFENWHCLAEVAGAAAGDAAAEMVNWCFDVKPGSQKDLMGKMTPLFYFNIRSYV